MAANGLQLGETPETTNQRMQSLGPGVAFSGALMVWSGIDDALPGLQLRRLGVYRDIPAPIAEMDAALALGQPVVIELDQSPDARFQNHWVLVYGKRGDDYLIHDPWPVPAERREVSLRQRYGFAGTPDEIVTAMAFFVRDPALPVGGALIDIEIVSNQIVANAGGAAIRKSPSTSGELLVRLPGGSRLQTSSPRAHVSLEDTWLAVTLADGRRGFVAAWLTRESDSAPVPAPLPFRVQVMGGADILNAGGLALRDPISRQVLARLPAGTVIVVQEEAPVAQAKIGQQNEWLRVQTDAGLIGVVAAWLVLPANARGVPGKGLAEAPQIQLPLEGVGKGGVPEIELVVIGTGTAQLRARPKAGKLVASLKPRTRLVLREPRARAANKLKLGAGWVKVASASGQLGSISARRVRLVVAKATKASTGKRAIGSTGFDPNDILRVFRTTPKASFQRAIERFVEPDLVFPEVVVDDDAEIREAGGLAIREQAGATYGLVARVPLGTVLRSGWFAADTARALAAPSSWLPVYLPDGRFGYCAAWYLRKGARGWSDIQTDPDPPTNVDAAIVQQRTLIARADADEPIRLRVAAAQDAPSHWLVPAGTPLMLAENGDDWLRKLGDANAWVRVQTHAFKLGYVRGAQVRAPLRADTRPPVLDAPLPYGISAYLYGVHDPFDRGIVNNSGRGWVLFTERVQSEAGNTAYEAWSKAGHGVIGRLNNDYGGSGTVPTPDKYDAFAQACANWVRNSRGCHAWVIGNEMNNPREWPNQPQFDPGLNSADEITPEGYADCFNRVRAAIKQVQPNAIVMPGALDCFQGPRMSCLDWFNRMLLRIHDLDAIALHCYTNGYSPDLITDMGTFGNDPLTWQYYHFRAYLTMLDAIPEKWRTRPVHITETDPHGADPWSGDGNGWIQSAYAELARHNRQPHAQQIQSLILYRWSTDDIYTLQRRPGAQNDLRSTVAGTDYRWRA